MIGIVVDNFAGGGGASTGIEAALGRPVDIAINHSRAAIAMHTANHPESRHYCEDIWTVDPKEAAAGRVVEVAWFSPDCTHFSRAKGGQPRKKEIRGLADVVIRWARAVKPRLILLENVEEFQTWGPLDDDGFPIKAREGEDFRAWLAKLVECGYSVEYRVLVAADYGAPTTRKRFFLVARCDGQPIVWPKPTHGRGRETPWRTAAEVIDWSLPCPSISGRKKPLADATMRRIAAGLRRYVIDAATPFIVPLTHQGPPRTYPLGEPLRTVTAANRGELALVTPYLATVTTTGGGKGGGHLAEVRAFLVKYYGSDGEPQSQQQTLFGPLHTVTTKARFGLVTVHGQQYQIADIGMRMLAPRELFAAQGFPTDYVIDPQLDGRPLTKTQQIELAGNSVCPPVAHALVAANVRTMRRAA